ncbi:MAG: 50S ribosomal protein L21e [Thermoprotei archaeon]
MKAKGYRRKGRSALGRNGEKAGFPPLRRWLATYEKGQKVVIDIWPGVYEGMPHTRYQGKVGQVLEKRGRCYVVAIPLDKRSAKLTVSPVHIRPAA